MSRVIAFAAIAWSILSASSAVADSRLAPPEMLGAKSPRYFDEALVVPCSSVGSCTEPVDGCRPAGACFYDGCCSKPRLLRLFPRAIAGSTTSSAR